MVRRRRRLSPLSEESSRTWAAWAEAAAQSPMDPLQSRRQLTTVGAPFVIKIIKSRQIASLSSTIRRERTLLIRTSARLPVAQIPTQVILRSLPWTRAETRWEIFQISPQDSPSPLTLQAILLTLSQPS